MVYGLLAMSYGYGYVAGGEGRKDDRSDVSFVRKGELIERGV